MPTVEELIEHLIRLNEAGLHGCIGELVEYKGKLYCVSVKEEDGNE